MSDSVKALIDLLMVDAMCNGEGTGITLAQLKLIRAELDRLQGTCDQLMVDSMRRTEELDQLKLEVELVMKGGK